MLLRRVTFGRVGKEPDALAELAAHHVPARHAPGLARQIHHRHLDAADAAGLTRRRAKLFDLSKDLVDVAGVLAQDPRLEHERVGLAGAVADLAPPDEPLIRVDPNQRADHGRPNYARDSEVSDIARRWLGR